MATDDIASKGPPWSEAPHRASSNSRSGRAALFAAAACVLGMLALLITQLGWWSILAAPAYLATLALVAMPSRTRTQALLAVALSTASMGIIVAMVKLTGLV